MIHFFIQFKNNFGIFQIIVQTLAITFIVSVTFKILELKKKSKSFKKFNFEEETYANSLVVSGINTNKKYKPTTPRVISQVVVPGLFTDEQTVLLRQLVDEYVYKKNSKQPWALIKKHGFSDFPLITNTKLRDKARSMGLID